MELIITAKIKLIPNQQQKQELLQTVQAIKQALNYTSKVAYNNNLLSTFTKLQKIVYYDLREQFGLKSQMACNVCSVVAGTYASMKKNGEKTLAVYNKPKFQYSYNRDYSFVNNKSDISLLTLNGRIKVPYVTKGMEQYFDGSWEFGTATLVHKKDSFYLHISVRKELQELKDTAIKNVVGIDFGMNYLATAIDSKDKTIFYSGKYIKNKKAQYLRVRKCLQSRGTKRAKRRLKLLSGKENRWMTDVNHCVSKALIQKAGENSLIALEDLTGMNLTAQVQKKDRYYRVSWAFAQLRFFLEYKAKLNNSMVIAFDPKHTSQKCPKCGHTHKNNRDKQNHVFCCKACGYTSNDDRIGAMNLRQMGIEYHYDASVQV